MNNGEDDEQSKKAKANNKRTKIVENTWLESRTKNNEEEEEIWTENTDQGKVKLNERIVYEIYQTMDQDDGKHENDAITNKMKQKQVEGMDGRRSGI